MEELDISDYVWVNDDPHGTTDIETTQFKNSFECLLCGRRLRTPLGLVDHCTVHCNGLTCFGCGVVCRSKQRLANHLKSTRSCRCQHQMFTYASGVDQCRKCGFLSFNEKAKPVEDYLLVD